MTRSRNKCEWEGLCVYAITYGNVFQFSKVCLCVCMANQLQPIVVSVVLRELKIRAWNQFNYNGCKQINVICGWYAQSIESYPLNQVYWLSGCEEVGNKFASSPLDTDISNENVKTLFHNILA